MNVVTATDAYEDWLGTQLELVEDDLKRKHKKMRKSAFVFMRATYYRWLQRIDDVAPDLTAPVVKCVGDLHVENFGTWRDAEGRLVWGINDFDESEQLPYSNDLARLACSALLAIDDGALHISPRRACEAVLHGYRESLTAGGRAFVLAGEHPALSRVVADVLAPGPARWWADLHEDAEDLPAGRDRVPAAASAALARVAPAGDWEHTVRARVAGVGSLGRRRLVLVGDHAGAPVARELKQLSPPAGVWLGRPASEGVSLTATVRSQDPFHHAAGGWVARRLAPDCVKLELASLDDDDVEERLLRAMGAETANIHLGSPAATARVLDDLDRRDDGWLHSAGTRLERAVRDDHEVWRGERAD